MEKTTANYYHQNFVTNCSLFIYKESSSHLSSREKEHYPVLLWQYVSHWRSACIFYTPVFAFFREIPVFYRTEAYGCKQQ